MLGPRLIAVVLAALLGQAPPAPVPQFPSGADAITVDVVVLDRQGRPLRGLRAEDFEVREDGRRQQVVAFEARERQDAGAEAEGLAAADLAVGIATNAATGRPGRAFAIVIDDMGLDPVRGAVEVKKALTRWLTTGADPSDAVTLVTTSGDVWWSDHVGRGREDLLAVVARVKGRRLDPQSETMSDWEAYALATEGSAHGRTLERVVERWVQGGACHPLDRRECERRARVRARELHDRTTRRTRATFTAVERLSEGLSASRGRKSIVVFSEGLIRDPGDEYAARAIASTQRANAAVSFVDVRGLAGQARYLTENADAPNPAELAAASVEENYLATAGGEYLAEATGGRVVRNTNDLAGGLQNIVEELASYYLVGYQPDRPPDGQWRKLEVRVARRGVKVRARKGYLAGQAPRPAVTTADATSNASGPLEPALAVAGERDEIPLRLSARSAGAGDEGLVRLLAGVEVDGAAAGFLLRPTADRQVTLELVLVATSRDEPRIFRTRDRVVVGEATADESGALAFLREVQLPPGVAKVRALVRDVATGRTGTVTLRVQVAPHGAGLTSAPVIEAVDPPSTRQTEFLTRDLPLLAALQAGTLVNAFEHRSDLLHFAPHGSLREARLLIAAPLESLAVILDEAEAERSSMDVMVLVQDDKGRLAARFKAVWPIERKLRAPTRSTDVLLQQPVRLPPGRYVVSTFLRAARGPGLSSRRQAFEVTAAGPLALSSLTLISGDDEGPSLPSPAREPAPDEAGARETDGALARLLEKAGRYVTAYEAGFRDLVAEETYTQWAGTTRRVTRAEIVYVSIPGPIPWTCFRDVLEVDGLKVREREDRIRDLFLRQTRATALERAKRIIEESARYNVGGAYRTANIPTLPLLFLHPRNQDRFAFERKGRRSLAGVAAVELQITERARPTLVSDGAGGDLPAIGRVFIDPERGTVIRTITTFRVPSSRSVARLSVEYRPDAALGLWLPTEMKEDYRDQGGTFDPVFRKPTEATARYARYRRFEVSVDEKASLPPK